MDPNPDLNAAPGEALLAIISQQQNTIAQLQRRIESLEGKAKPGGLRGMPGVKPKSGQRPSSITTTVQGGMAGDARRVARRLA